MHPVSTINRTKSNKTRPQMSSKQKTKKKEDEEQRTKGSLSMQEEEMSRDPSFAAEAAAAAAVVVADSVDPRRKHQLLLEARADRLRWIQSIPLPYATSMLLSSNTNNNNTNNNNNNNSSSSSATTSTATTAMTTPGGNLLPLTHAGKHLQSIEPILLQLYGSQQTAKEHVQELIPEPTESSYNLAVPSGNEVLEEAIHHNDVSICDQATLEAYRRFLNQLQSPSSAALANGIRTFCRKLTTVVTDANPAASPQTLAKSLQTYVDSTMETIQTLWTSTTDDNKNNNNTTTTTSTAVLRPSLESFVYGQCFPSIWSTVRDDAQDKECAFRCQSLSFLEPKHLDVACLKDTNDLPILCLLSVDAFFSPQSKLHRILETYRGVNETLQKALNAKEGQDDGSSDNNKAADATKLPSADDVLPTLILTVLHAEPQSIVSNLRFVEMFCTAEQLRGEAGYAFTNLYGAVQFILDLNLDSPSTTLTISPEEFVKGVEECRVKAETKMKEITSGAAAAAAPPPPTENAVDISVQAVREARQRGEVVDMDWARRWILQQQQTAAASVDIVSSMSLPAAGQDSTEQPLPEALPPGFVRNYTFLAARPEDIHMTELPRLLDEYRMLAKTVELLLGERAARLATERKRRLQKAQRAIEENALAAGVSLDYHYHNNNKKETMTTTTTPVQTTENPTVETVTND